MRGSLRFLVSLGMTIGILISSPVAVSANTAALVIVHGDGTVLVKTVKFSEPSISGIELIKRAGVANAIEKGSAGEAVYMLDNEGDPTGWSTKDGQSYYWSYFRLSKDNLWEYSKIGAGISEVTNGTVDGWLWQYYGENKGFPAVSIPTMGVEVAGKRTNLGEPGTSKINTATQTVTATAAAKKDTGKTPWWAYLIGGLIVVALLAAGLFQSMRPRPRRRK